MSSWALWGSEEVAGFVEGMDCATMGPQLVQAGLGSDHAAPCLSHAKYQVQRVQDSCQHLGSPLPGLFPSHIRQTEGSSTGGQRLGEETAVLVHVWNFGCL